MRLPALLILTFLLAGCNSPPSSFDPFLGRTTVPPPGTIPAPQAGVGQPYYRGAPVPGTVPPTGRPLSPAARPTLSPGPGTTTAPPSGSPPLPGTYGVPQSGFHQPKAVRPGPDEYLAGTSAIARRSPVTQASPTGGGPVTLTGAVSGTSTAGNRGAWHPASAGNPAATEPGRLPGATAGR